MVGGVERTDVYGNPGSRDHEIYVVRAIYEAFERRDVETVLAHVSDDVTFEALGTAAAAGRAEPYHGHAGVRQYFADAARIWDSLDLRTDDVRAAAGGVVVFGQITGRAGDRVVRRRVLWTWRLRAGKAVSMRVNDLGEAPAD